MKTQLKELIKKRDKALRELHAMNEVIEMLTNKVNDIDHAQ